MAERDIRARRREIITRKEEIYGQNCGEARNAHARRFNGFRNIDCNKFPALPRISEIYYLDRIVVINTADMRAVP